MSYPENLDEISEDRLMEEVHRRRNLLARGLCTYCERPGKSRACKFPERHAEARPLNLSHEDAFHVLSWNKKVEALTSLIHKLTLAGEDVRNDHFKILGKRFDEEAMASRDLNDGLNAVLKEAMQMLGVVWRGGELPRKRKTGDMPATRLDALREESKKR